MPKAKHLSKDQVVAAMNKTKSVRAAARYLNVSYIHMKKWMKFYKNENGITLFEAHKNQSGKGIPKFLSNNGTKKKDPALLDVIEGRIDPAHFNPQKIKYRLIEEGYLKEECCNCGFHERRVSDYKIPLILHFKDKNKQHYRLENMEMLCYNCYFLMVGDVFNNKQIEGLEDHKPVNESKVEWELDDYTLQRLKDLGLEQTPPPEDGSEFISRI
jgi:hypothetical protein